MDVIRAFGPTTPILGVCLGHQALGAVLRRLGGAGVGADARQDVDDRAQRPRRVQRTDGAVSRLAVSLADRVRRRPAGELEVTARTREDGIIMGLRHRSWPVHGVQFHPEVDHDRARDGGFCGTFSRIRWTKMTCFTQLIEKLLRRDDITTDEALPPCRKSWRARHEGRLPVCSSAAR
jgi:GMP synthase-like glutamine amidotransferase